MYTESGIGIEKIFVEVDQSRCFFFLLENIIIVINGFTVSSSHSLQQNIDHLNNVHPLSLPLLFDSSYSYGNFCNPRSL